MLEKWKKYFRALGFSETESRLYLEVLEMGPSSVQEIAKVVGLSRVSVYAVIETLTRSGLMTSVEKGKKRLYAAEPPERIVSLAEKKASDLGAAVKGIKNSIQELKLAQAGEKPIVKMYEGSEVFVAMQEDLLANRPEQICEFGNIDEIDRLYPYERLAPLHKQLAKLKLKRRLIYQTKEGLRRPDEPNKQIKYLKGETKYFPGDFFIYKDTVWLVSFSGKQITVMIKSRAIKETLQAAFDILWESL